MNRLTLAVAGGRKTQSIVDECSGSSAEHRILVLTYTQANQEEIGRRLALSGPFACRIDVQGWFSFLLTHWVRPYLPRLFGDKRLRGLNFDGDPGQYAKDERRFLDSEQRAYSRHLARFAFEVNKAAGGAPVDRLSRIYDVIYLDEVQDLNGWDLEILTLLMASDIELRMVGDIRQAILSTNPRDPKHSQYKGTNVVNWFRKREKAGALEIRHRNVTWRSSQAIADLADSVFTADWGFPATHSENQSSSGHQGIFAVAIGDAEAYAERHSPLCLRPRVTAGNQVSLPYTNIGQAKGLESEHVLIWPAGTMLQFLRKGTSLKPLTSCSFYVAVTRARHSVAFIAEKPATLGLPVWTPD